MCIGRYGHFWREVELVLEGDKYSKNSHLNKNFKKPWGFLLSRLFLFVSWLIITKHIYLHVRLAFLWHEILYVFLTVSKFSKTPVIYFAIHGYSYFLSILHDLNIYSFSLIFDKSFNVTFFYKSGINKRCFCLMNIWTWKIE